MTAAQLDIAPELRPWVDRYRPYALAVLARALVAARHGALAPCLFIHGPAGSGKSGLATAMVRECEAVWCLDAWPTPTAYEWLLPWFNPAPAMAAGDPHRTRRRSRLAFSDHIASLLPLYGRSHGPGPAQLSD